MFLFFFLDKSLKRIKGTKDLVYIAGPRGTLKMVMRGYSFVRNKGKKGVSYYRCSNWKKHRCRSKFTVFTPSNEIVYKNLEHNHPPDCDEL